MALFFVVLAVGAGSLIPVQAGVNASLRSVLGSPVLATISNFVVGLSLLTGYAVASHLRLPTLSHLATAPWWYWLGGSMGVLLVLSGVVFIPSSGGNNIRGLYHSGSASSFDCY